MIHADNEIHFFNDTNNNDAIIHNLKNLKIFWIIQS